MQQSLMRALGGSEQLNRLDDKVIAAALEHMPIEGTLRLLNDVMEEPEEVIDLLFIRAPDTAVQLLKEDIIRGAPFFDNRGRGALSISGERLKIVLPVLSRLEGALLGKALWSFYPEKKASIVNALTPNKVVELLGSIPKVQGTQLLKEIEPQVASSALAGLDAVFNLNLLESLFADDRERACHLAALAEPRRLIEMLAQQNGHLSWHSVISEMLGRQRYREFAELCELLEGQPRLETFYIQFLKLVPKSTAKGLLPLLSTKVLARFLGECFRGQIPAYPNLSSAEGALSGERIAEISPSLSSELLIALFRAIVDPKKRKIVISELKTETAANILKSCPDREVAELLEQLSPKAAGDLLMRLDEKPEIIQHLSFDALSRVFEYLKNREQVIYQLVSKFGAKLDKSNPAHLHQMCGVFAALPAGISHENLRLLRYQWLFEQRLSLAQESWELLENSLAPDTLQYVFFREGTVPAKTVFDNFPRITYSGGQSDRAFHLKATANDGAEKSWQVSPVPLVNLEAHDYRYCARRDPDFAKKISAGSEFEEFLEDIEEQNANTAHYLVTLLPILRPALKDSDEPVQKVCAPLVTLLENIEQNNDYYSHLLNRTVAQLVQLKIHAEFEGVLERLAVLIEALQKEGSDAEEDIQSLVVDILPGFFAVAENAGGVIESLDMARRFITTNDFDGRIQLVRRLLLMGHHPYPIINLIRAFADETEQIGLLKMIAAYRGLREDGQKPLPSPVAWDILSAKETRLSVHLPDYWEYLNLDEIEREQKLDARGVELLNQIYDDVVEERHLIERDVYLGDSGLQRRILDAWGENIPDAFGKYTDLSYNSTVLLSILTILTNRRLLLIGPPGQGKTTTAEDLGQRILGLPLPLIQAATIWGHPDLTEEKMIARFDVGRLLKDGVEVIYPRVFALFPYRIIDEINRIPATSLSVLYQLIDRGLCVYANERIIIPSGPLFATANKQDDGNWKLPPPIVDRFDAAVIVHGINPQGVTRLGGNIVRKTQQIEDILADLKTKDIADILAENRIYQRRLRMIERIRRDIDEKVVIAPEAAWRLQFFLSQLTYCKELGRGLEAKDERGEPAHKRKSEGYFGDIYKLCEGCEYFQNRERHEICYNTMTMPSIRSYDALIAYSKALVWWRAPRPLTGKQISAGVAEIRALLPYVLMHRLEPHDKLASDEQIDIRRMQWIRELWDISMKKYDEIKSAIEKYNRLHEAIQRATKDTAGKIQDKSALTRRIAHAINEIDKLDTVAKYSMRITLIDDTKRLMRDLY